MNFKLFLILVNLTTFIVLINYPIEGDKIIRLSILILLILFDLLTFIIIKVYKSIKTLEKFYYEHVCEDDEKINEFLNNNEYNNFNIIDENEEDEI